MAGHGSKLHLKLEQAVLLLLQTGDLTETATQCDIGVSTLQRWMRRDDFRTRYQAARTELLTVGLSKLALLTGRAITTLEATLNDPWTKGSTKVQAARAILDIALKVLGVDEDDDDRSRPPVVEPDCDLSKLTPDEWRVFKKLYLKCRPYKNHAPLPSQPMLVFPPSSTKE